MTTVRGNLLYRAVLPDKSTSLSSPLNGHPQLSSSPKTFVLICPPVQRELAIRRGIEVLTRSGLAPDVVRLTMTRFFCCCSR